MRYLVWIGAVAVTLMAGSRGVAWEPQCCEPPQGCLVERMHPVGGWHPDGGGLLHWWPKCCFPRCGAPNDYCRKPPPCVCWPRYPPYYIWGPPEICCPQNCCRTGNGKAH
jgi:hypothetical protein